MGKGLNNRETAFLIANMLELNLLSLFWSVHRVVGWQHYAQDRVVFQKDGIKVRCIGSKRREGNGGRNCGGIHFFMTQCVAHKWVLGEHMKHLNFASEW